MLTKWKLLPDEFGTQAKITVPRCYFVTKKRPISYQMHGFSDACEEAIAAAVFVRTEYEDGDIEVCSTTYKARV